MWKQAIANLAYRAAVALLAYLAKKNQAHAYPDVVVPTIHFPDGHTATLSEIHQALMHFTHPDK